MKIVRPRSRLRDQEIADFYDAGRIQAVGRFVQQDQLRLMEKSPCQAQPLEIPGREHASTAIRIGCQAETLDGAGRRYGIGDAVQPAGDLQILAHRKLRICGGTLDEMSDAPPRPAAMRADRSAKERHRARAGPTRRHGPRPCGPTGPPKSDTEPALGRIIPSSARIVVVLPAPLRPRKP